MRSELPPDLLATRLRALAATLTDAGFSPERVADLRVAADALADFEPTSPSRHDPVINALGPPSFTIPNPTGLSHVYVAHGPQGTILYVGRSDNVLGRLAHHLSDAHGSNDTKTKWMRYATHVDVYRTPDRQVAIDMERELIDQLQPLANVHVSGRRRKVNAQAATERGRVPGRKP